MDYYTGFMIEKSLSMDNVFVIALIFGFFAIPRRYQHRVLFWGILGVIVLRAIMIGLAATLVSQYSWVLYIFGAFLIFTGIKMWIIADHMPDIANNLLLRFLKRHMRVTDGLCGTAFWVREPDIKTGKLERFATPLFLALVLVEFVDLILPRGHHRQDGCGDLAERDLRPDRRFRAGVAVEDPGVARCRRFRMTHRVD